MAQRSAQAVIRPESNPKFDLENPRAILRPPEAATYLGLTTSTLAKRRLRGEPPIFVRLGVRAVGYRRTDLDAWLLSCRRRSTSDQGNSLNMG